MYCANKKKLFQKDHRRDGATQTQENIKLGLLQELGPMKRPPFFQGHRTATYSYLAPERRLLVLVHTP